MHISRRQALAGIATIPAVTLPAAADNVSNGNVFGAGSKLFQSGTIVNRVSLGNAISPHDQLTRLNALADEAVALMPAYNAWSGSRWELRIRADDGFYPIMFHNLRSRAREV